MTRVRILKAAEQHHLPVSNLNVSADIPIDDKFHEIPDELLGALENSSVEFEIEESDDTPAGEIENADATGGTAAAGDAAELGGSAASPPSQPDPLDHDKDGAKGGSEKGAASTRAKGAAKKKATAKAK